MGLVPPLLLIEKSQQDDEGGTGRGPLTSRNKWAVALYKRAAFSF